MVVFKEDHSLFATTVPPCAYSLSSFNPCFELKSIAVLSCSNSLTSVSLLVMPYTLQSGTRGREWSAVRVKRAGWFRVLRALERSAS